MNGYRRVLVALDGSDAGTNALRQACRLSPSGTVTRRWRPRKGDRVEVEWLDIVEDPVRDPRDARPAERLTIGYWVGYRGIVTRGGEKVRVAVTTTTKEEPASQSGWCCYPAGAIKRMWPLRRDE